MKCKMILLFAFIILAMISSVKAQQDAQKGSTEYNDPECIRFKSDLRYIILVRHGKPLITRKRSLNRIAMQEYFYAYDTVAVEPFKVKMFCNPDQVDIVYTSMLNRSKNTAEQLFKEYDTPTHEDEMFNEFERKVFKFPNLKMPFSFWSFNSRLFWVLGFNHKGIESFREAKQRAESCANFLEKKSLQNDRVVLVGHGFMNRYIKKYLKKNDWDVKNLNGQRYLGVYLLSKEIQQ